MNCPKCRQEIVNYGCSEQMDFTHIYPFTCKCGFKGREIYEEELENGEFKEIEQKKEKQRVFVGHIDHRHGINTYVHRTRNGLMNAIDEYIKEW